jgi:3'-phosphoadenosine 5'-phosphosulfate sulfotransferase (PAPS reductase)/FAD synthetase
MGDHVGVCRSAEDLRPSAPFTAVLDALTSGPRSSEGLVEGARRIIEQAKAEHEPLRTFVLFSGGNDSHVLLDADASMADEVVHVNTGIGIPETTEFARRVGSSYGIPFTELHPPVPYEELVLGRWRGLPGPGAHRFTYTMLKERPLEQLLRDHRTKRGQRFLLLTGVRLAESKRRMGHVTPMRRKGGQVWVNPLLDWTNEEMNAYRKSQNLPVNEVSANLHMSGECMCGAMADQGPKREERALLRFFYPEFDARLTDIERQAKDAGLRYCEWGVKRRNLAQIEELPFEPMCMSCEFRNGGEAA